MVWLPDLIHRLKFKDAGLFRQRLRCSAGEASPIA